MINVYNPSSAAASNGQLKLTATEIDYLQQYLNRGDRGGYYVALYNLTGNEQALIQAQVATFSQATGGSAFAANALLQAGMEPGT